MRKEVPLGIAGFVGFVILADYFLQFAPLNSFSKTLQDWAVVVSAFALGLASVSLVARHARMIAAKKTDWGYSILLLLGLGYFAAAGIGWGITNAPFKVVYEAFFSPVGAATFSLLVFFIASASFRAFKIRNKEAAVLLICGIIVMLGNAPVGETISSAFPQISGWLMKVPNVAGNRGVMIGAALGTMAVGIRTLLGLDRGYLGLDQ